MKTERDGDPASGDLVERLARRFAEAMFDFGERWISGGWIGRGLEQWDKVREERFAERLRHADDDAFREIDREEPYDADAFFMGYNPREDKFRTIDPDTGVHWIYSRSQVESAWGRGEPSGERPSPDQHSFDKLWFGNEGSDQGPDRADAEAHRETMKQEGPDLDR